MVGGERNTARAKRLPSRRSREASHQMLTAHAYVDDGRRVVAFTGELDLATAGTTVRMTFRRG